MTSGRPGIRLRSGQLAAVLIAWAVFQPSLVDAQVVRGVVLSEPDSSRVPAAMVILHRITGDAGTAMDSTRSDAEGRFQLAIPGDDTPQTVYAAAAVRDGVSYFGPIMHSGEAPPVPYRILVAESEVISEPVRKRPVAFRHLVISPVAHGLLQVAEIVDVKGVPGRALRMEDESRAIWSIQLPAGARSWSAMQGGLPPEALRFLDDRVEARATLPPNGMRLAYSYFTEGAKLEIPVEQATDRLEVILVGAEEEKLTGLRQEEISNLPPGAAARRFVASDVAPGSSLGLSVRSERQSRGPVLTWSLIGVALLAAAALSAVAGRRSPE